MYKNMLQPASPQMTNLYDAEKMRFSCRMTMAIIDTPSQYVMLTAFQRQRWLLLERACVTFHVHWLFCSALKLTLI